MNLRRGKSEESSLCPGATLCELAWGQEEVSTGEQNVRIPVTEPNPTRPNATQLNTAQLRGFYLSTIVPTMLVLGEVPQRGAKSKLFPFIIGQAGNCTGERLMF